MIGSDGCIFQVKSLILCSLPLFPLFIGIECKFSKICLTTQTKTSLEEIEEPFEEPQNRINHLALQFWTIMRETNILLSCLGHCILGTLLQQLNIYYEAELKTFDLFSSGLQHIKIIYICLYCPTKLTCQGRGPYCIFDRAWIYLPSLGMWSLRALWRQSLSVAQCSESKIVTPSVRVAIKTSQQEEELSHD